MLTFRESTSMRGRRRRSSIHRRNDWNAEGGDAHTSISTSTQFRRRWSEYFTERGNERYLLVIPTFHIWPDGCMLVGAWRGAMQINTKFDADMMVEAFNQYHNVLPRVPSISLLNRPKIRECPA